METKENYNALSKKIKEAVSESVLRKIETSIDRIYDTGLLTEKEASKLYVQVMVKSAELEIEA